MNVRVTVEVLGIGLSPVSQARVKEIRALMCDPPPRRQALVYLQEHDGDEFVAGLPRRARWQVANWGEAVVRMSEDEFFAMCGVS